MRRRQIFGVGGAIAGSALPATAGAAVVDERPQWWPSLARYRQDDAALKGAVDCVFMGDSITERWRQLRPAFFSPGRVCRGITGQTTPQMLVRFRADVVDLKPAMVHIMAGTNDIAGNTGPSSPETIQGYIRSMTELALCNGIRVVLASIPPATHYDWAPRVDPVGPTRAVNAWLKQYASDVGAAYADYYAKLDDGHGGMSPGPALAGVHPTAAAYAEMEPVALDAMERARGLPQHKLCRA